MNALPASDRVEAETSLPPDGERFLPGMRGRIATEHLLRYAWARSFVAGKRVLDVASGEGYGSAFLSTDAAEVVGVDISEAAIRHAQARYGDRRDLSFKTGDVCQLPFVDQSFDVVVSFETIEHVADPRQAIKEFRRVLKRDGILIVSTPNRKIYSEKYGYTNKFHLHEMTLEEFTDALVGEFATVGISAQIATLLSLIVGLDELQGLNASRLDPDRLTFEGSNLPEAPQPEDVPVQYYVAVCGPAGLTDTHPAVSYFDAMDDSVVQNEMALLKVVAGDDGKPVEADSDEVPLLRAELQDKTRLLGDLQQEVFGLRGAVDDLKRQEAACRDEIRQLSGSRAEASTLRETLGSILREHHAAEQAWMAELAQVSTAMHQLQTSTTWRATSPLRAVISRLKRTVRGLG